MPRCCRAALGARPLGSMMFWPRETFALTACACPRIAFMQCLFARLFVFAVLSKSIDASLGFVHRQKQTQDQHHKCLLTFACKPLQRFELLCRTCATSLHVKTVCCSCDLAFALNLRRKQSQSRGSTTQGRFPHFGLLCAKATRTHSQHRSKCPRIFNKARAPQVSCDFSAVPLVALGMAFHRGSPFLISRCAID